jgi:hypothetical protein
MLEDVCLQINEDASGANGPKRTERAARIMSAAGILVDYVSEYLDDDGVHLNEHDLFIVRWCVAVAMIAQHDHDAEMWRGVMGKSAGKPTLTLV